MCVCRATDYTGETRCSLFSCPLALTLPLLCVCERVHFHGHALTGGTCEVLCTLYRCHEASMQRILSRAALARCASHRHTHGAPLWIHCCSAKGFPMIKASLLLVQVLKKLKQRGGGGWRGTWWDSELTSSSWQSRNVLHQNCSRNTASEPTNCSNSFSYQ